MTKLALHNEVQENFREFKYLGTVLFTNDTMQSEIRKKTEETRRQMDKQTFT